MTKPEILTDRPATGTMGRRNFLVTAAGGLTLSFFLPQPGRVLFAGPVQTQLNSWIRIGADGSVTLSFGGCEMGQGAMTGLSQILAEELKVDWTQVRTEQSLADPKVSYITGGSSAVSGRFMPLRQAAATVRELLISAAVIQAGDSNRANYSCAHGVVTYTNPTTHVTKAMPYATLAAVAASQPIPANIPLTPASQFQLIGTPVQRVDIPQKTDGSAIYGIDVRVPGMVYAVIKHCPTIGGTLAATPSKPSSAIAVVPCKASDSRGVVMAGNVNAVAVVASDTWTAKNIAQQLQVKWTLPASTASVDTNQLLAQAQQLLASGAPIVAEPSNPTPAASVIEAQVGNALAGAKVVIDSTYALPYLSHATMEVVNCTVNLTATSCEVWAPSQAAMWVLGTVQTLTGLTASQITVHTTLLGGGLGRKIEQDYISQAVQVAMAVKKPVKLMWTREEDFGHDQYRPAALVRVRAGLDTSNNITAWWYRNVSSSILGQRGWLPPGAPDSQATEGAVKLPYALGSHVMEWVPIPAGIPVGFWRSVGSSINAFAVESMIDELAAKAGIDPFTFRNNIIGDQRTKTVLAAADTASSWRRTLPSGHFWGMAIAESFGTIVCEVVDISNVTTTSFKVNRVALVVDCGQAINPNSIEAQMQGGIVHGMNAALWGLSTFTNGVANQRNFNNYRMMRPNEMPSVTVQVIPSSNAPSGIGEPAVPPIAPALANAYFKATGNRVRTLPFFPGARMGDL